MRPLCRVIVVVFLAALPALAETPVAGLKITSHIPADPVLVWAVKAESAAAELDSVLGLIGEMTPPEKGLDAEAILAKADAALGVSLRNDLLARLGPEMAFVVDLPPLDSLMGVAAGPTPETMDRALGGIGLVAQVREPKAFATALKTALESADAVVTFADGAWKAVLKKADADKGEPELALHWRIADGWLAMGVAPSWPAAAAPQRPAGGDLRTGADFQKVAAHLDKEPVSLVYLNLPKVAAMVRESGFVQGVASSKPEAKAALDTWVNSGRLAVGWGSTTVKMDGGVRTTAFGPDIISGKLFTGVIAAVAIPNFMNAVGKGRTKQTIAEVRTLATALETYAVDHEQYPETGGWVATEALVDMIVPEYVASAPTEDGWGQAYKVFSTAQHYAVVSAGPNGQVDGDWTPPLEGEVDTQATDDIVWVDGQWVSFPEGEGY